MTIALNTALHVWLASHEEATRELAEVERALSRIEDRFNEFGDKALDAVLCISVRAKDIDALIGDFEERFARECAAGMSRRRAVAQYRSRVLRSIWPLR
jgi:hypothetical protein